MREIPETRNGNFPARWNKMTPTRPSTYSRREGRMPQNGKIPKKSPPTSCKCYPDGVKYLCMSAVGAVASVSWSINSCFFGFGNRVKKQGWILFSFCSIATAGFNRMSGSFFTFGLCTGCLHGRAPPIVAGYAAECSPHHGRAPPVCTAVLHRQTARHFGKTMNQKRERHTSQVNPFPKT